MGIIISLEKELEWIEKDIKRQNFYFVVLIVFFIFMVYALAKCLLMENISRPIYGIAFIFSFQAFMAMVIVYTKSRRYLDIIEALLEERRR